MPRSPTSAQDKDSIAAYHTAWKATMKLLREGRSFSGHERNCVFLNCRGKPFADVSAVTGLDFDDDGRALGVTDWDQDGDLDVWMLNRTGPRLRLMRNQTIRPDTKETANFVAFHLQGTDSNRDAIGARVSVELNDTDISTPESRILIQTLTAGDAYLSQSSKWLHFGLGQATKISRVSVRWPSGTIEHFDDIQPGSRYSFIEGQGQANLLPKTVRAIALTSAPQPHLAPSDTIRTYFSNRLPMPQLRFTPFASDETRVIGNSHQPLLLTLWASWCGPCVTELQALTQHADRLRQAGLQVLALSVDGLDQSQPSQPADAEALLNRLQFAFDSGVATREMLDKLVVCQGLLFNQLPGLVVPTSWLIDANGELAVVYQGPVEIDELLGDIQRLNIPLRDRRDLAVPLAGRWLSPPRQLLMRAVARVFQESGYEEDYARYLQMDAHTLERQRSLAQSDDEREQVDRQYAAASFNLGLALLSAGDTSEAIAHFERAVQTEPQHVDALVNLGALLAQAGRTEDAIGFLQRAVSADSNSIPAHLNLAAALIDEQKFGEALPHYQYVLAAQPDNAQVHTQIARSLLELGDVITATQHLQDAVRLNSRDTTAALCLAWIRSTNPDEALRNGPQAVELAETLAANSRGRNPLFLDVLAAAYAEQGEFAKATETLDEALRLLTGQRNAGLRQVLRTRQKVYEQRQAYRDADGKYP